MDNRFKPRALERATIEAGAAWFRATILIVVVAVCACAPTRPSPPTPTGLASINTRAPTPSLAASPNQSPSAVATLTMAATSTPAIVPQTATPSAVVTPGSDASATAQSEDTAVAGAVGATVTAYVAGYLTAVATPVATVTIPPTVPTLSPQSISPTSTQAAVAGCPVQPVRGFGLVYTSNPTVTSGLGCAVESEVGLPSTIQSFEGGLMFAIGGRIFVLKTTGATWTDYPASTGAGQSIPAATLTPPAGRFVPTGSLGQLWQTQPDVRSALGWAVAPEQASSTGALEVFARGRMLWSPAKIIYVLYANNTWQSFPDLFTG